MVKSFANVETTAKAWEFRIDIADDQWSAKVNTQFPLVSRGQGAVSRCILSLYAHVCKGKKECKR